MTYSRNNKVLKNIIVSWVVVLAIGIVMGLGFSKIGQAHSVKALQPIDEIEPYGTINGKTFKRVSLENWTSGSELGFTPLEVGLDEEIQRFIYYLSYGNNIDYTFVMGVIQTESKFNPSVVSPTNDYGLMQINKINHDFLKEKLGLTDLIDPYQNTIAGIYVLRNLFEKYEDPAKVLMAYNLGETGAKKLWEQGIYETDYTIKVFSNMERFKNYIRERNESYE